MTTEQAYWQGFMDKMGQASNWNNYVKNVTLQGIGQQAGYKPSPAFKTQSGLMGAKTRSRMYGTPQTPTTTPGQTRTNMTNRAKSRIKPFTVPGSVQRM